MTVLFVSLSHRRRTAPPFSRGHIRAVVALAGRETDTAVFRDEAVMYATLRRSTLKRSP